MSYCIYLAASQAVTVYPHKGRNLRQLNSLNALLKNATSELSGVFQFHFLEIFWVLLDVVQYQWDTREAPWPTI